MNGVLGQHNQVLARQRSGPQESYPSFACVLTEVSEKRALETESWECGCHSGEGGAVLWSWADDGQAGNLD